ncbi:MDN1 midasin [Cryptosporidium ubiquitum]|uniref:Midasin n=1 Tax=Cryptosporidium ubiquitum TaxID=857276 RepID=A0A1J4MMS4_9CRYT|nr:MDN1 midasin [Cryptosporidium ubiquitum]OII75562.1 MDN1 midasin [Cryptosporidium ubiquitum]
MSLIERSRIILEEVKAREQEIRLIIKDTNYEFGINLKDAINKLDKIFSTLDGSQLQNTELISRISMLLRRMVLYSEIGDIILERFPVIIFGLIEDVFKDGIEYKEHGILETSYISRYLYLMVSLLDLPYFVDSFSLFWCKEEDRKRELLLLLESVAELLSGLGKIEELNKEEILTKVRDLMTINLLWERVVPVREYLKVNHKLYEIIERFMHNLQNYKELNKTIKYLFLRLYSNVVQLGEEGKIKLYRQNDVQDLLISIQINQEYADKDQMDLYLQYFIFNKPHLTAFSLVFSKSNIEVNGGFKKDIRFNQATQNQIITTSFDEMDYKTKNQAIIENKTINRKESTILDIYDEEVISNLKELALSSILTRSSLIFLESINNGLQIYFNLIDQIKISHFENKHQFKIVRLYLDNSVDSKSLLGNWVVGDKPGEFKWEYGILSLCLINGDWLLIENIQDAPKDVIIKLNEISEKICQPFVNGCNITQTRIQETHYFELSEFNRKIKIHPNFRIFASCVFSNSKNHLNNNNYINKDKNEKLEIINPIEYINADVLRLLNNDKWNICSIPTPTNKELRRGIETNYENLFPIKEELLESFTNLVSFMNNPSNFSENSIAKSLNTRKPSCNDFFKGCESISKQYFFENKDCKNNGDNKNFTFLNEKLRMNISMLFGSILVDHISLKGYRNQCQAEISRSFGINSKESEYYLKNGKFDIHFINKGEQSRNISSINILNKELNIDININLLRESFRNSVDPSSSRLVLKTTQQDDYKYLNYTFTSIHSKIMFKIIMSIYNNENILLVGDTGTGKTTIIQQLHYMLYGTNKSYINEHLEEGEDKFCELLVYNFNEQSESSDIIGSFRPINIYNEVKLLYDDYLVLLEKSNISRKKNETIINYLLSLLKERKWEKFINNLIIIIDKLLSEFDNILKNQNSKKIKEKDEEDLDGKDNKSKIDSDITNHDKKKVNKRTVINIEDIWTLKIYWKDLRQKCLIKLKDSRIKNSENERQKHYFEFLDGILLKAIKEGHWLILDEINLASIDILQRLIPILNRGSCRNHPPEIEIICNNTNFGKKNRSKTQNNKTNDSDYLIIPEKGNEMIKIHPRFRLFSCMNPVSVPIEQKEQTTTSKKDEFQLIQIKSTSGKKELPQLIRALFTEYFVDELTERKDLEDVVYNYLKDVLLTNQINISTLVDIYLELKNMGNKHEITIGLEGNGHGIPNFSLRTFSSCLSYIRTILMLQGNWRRNQNKLKLLEFIGEDNKEKDNIHVKNGNSIIQNAILKQEISEIIHNGVMMSFATPLVSDSYNKVDKLTRRILKMSLKEVSNGKISSFIESGGKKNVDMGFVSFSAPRLGSDENQLLLSNKVNFINYILITDYIVRMGIYNKNFKLSNVISNDFVITPYVEQNLRKILRILSGSRNPILIEGETSTGKTSLIKYVSELTNHKFVRINNHEHTDTEEYFGKFVPNSQGELEFVEGPLVNSIRNGYWLVLDELNLAPSEVLESLNRLLDSNREIYIPETGEIIKAHEDFMLFATQNPAGSIYGGRKVLSQAFRNRFVEIYFDEIPSKELEIIISKRSNIPVSYSQLMVKVFMELKTHRSKSQMFSGDFSFVTVRDLLRWGNRLVYSKNNILDKKNLVIQGFYVIGERIRDKEEKLQLAEILYNICKPFEIKSIEEIVNYSTYHISSLIEDKDDERLKKKRRKEDTTKDGKNNDITKKCIISIDDIGNSDKNLLSLKNIINSNGDYVLTDSFKRMLTLVNDCIVFNEPVILVGSTGCGKTSIFQLLSTLYKKQLYIVNCHQQIEASDMLGSLRPIRSKIMRLNQELNNFKIELLRINDRIISNTNYIQQEFGNSISVILCKIDNLNRLLDESGTSNSEHKIQYSEKKQKIHCEISSITIMIESILEKVQNCDFPEILLLLDNMLNELRLYESGESQKEQALFEWQDGPIIKAMKTGSFLLLDEINLCDDSVIERLNSLLEDHYIKSEFGLSYKSRVIYLTEKGGVETLNGNDDYVIYSHKDFRIFATMNPSGDYGKRELSPALRNRFNEIFVPSLSMYQLRDDIEFLILRNVNKLSEGEVSLTNKKMLSKCIIMFSILYENDIKNDQILKIKTSILDQEVSNYFNLMIENGSIQLFKEENNHFISFGGESGNSSDVKEYTIRDIISWCQFICNNFQEISNFYNSNKDNVIDYIIKNGNIKELINLKDNCGIDNNYSIESMILVTLVLGELFIQGASMLILDGIDCQNIQDNEEEGFNLYLIYMERLIEIFYTYLIIPSFKENNIEISKIIKDIMIFRFLSDHGNNWIKVGGGRVFKKESKKDQNEFSSENQNKYLVITQDYIELGPFKVKRKKDSNEDEEINCNVNMDIEKVMKKFTFDSKTTLRNLSSIIRSMSIMKPILLEGAPGIGKTAIILNLSRLVGVKLHRINMSEQTDFSDLFGCEVPNNESRDQNQNKYQDQSNNSKNQKQEGRLINWIDGILLYAMKNGDWVILDELNLATQQILEGLNSVMDHRRNIYIPEIGQTILCHENFRIFATQNPVKMGSSGRKGLPQSFLNRFVRINVGKLNYEDYLVICKSLFLNDSNNLTDDIINLCIEITQEIELFNTNIRTLKDGSIWEWNLRDIIRLLRFVKLNLARNLNLKDENNKIRNILVFNSIYCSFETVYLSRLRTREDYYDIKSIIDRRLKEKMGEYEKEKSQILGIANNIIDQSILDYINNGDGSFKKMIIFQDYLKSYILNDGIKLIYKDSYGLSDHFKDLDLNILPINSKKRIISIIDCILLGENIILTCNNGAQIEEVISSIENISKNYFQNIRVNKVNILPSIDANDLIGGYQQYNEENIINEILDLVSSLRVIDFDISNYELGLINKDLIEDNQSNNMNKKLLNRLNLAKLNNMLNKGNENFVLELRNYLNFFKDIKTKITPIGILEEIESKLNAFELTKNKSKIEIYEGPKFNFTFSALINSIKNGDWLIITNIQNCSSALLDRLNSLLEDKENDLFIIESGIPQYVKRHENFRLFFVNDYNIQNKYISNALINRCIEIFVDDDEHHHHYKKHESNLKEYEEMDSMEVESIKKEFNDLKQDQIHLKEILKQVLFGTKFTEPLEEKQIDLLSKSQSQVIEIDDGIQKVIKQKLLISLFGCKKCIEELIVTIVERNKSYNRQVLDFVKIHNVNHFMNNNTSYLDFCSNFAIYLAAIIIYGINNYILEKVIKINKKLKNNEKSLYSHSDSLCILNKEEFQIITKNFTKEQIQIMETVGCVRFFINWMRNLLFSVLNRPRKLKRMTKSYVFSVIEDSLVMSFKQLGFIQILDTIEDEHENLLNDHFANFYLLILKMIENSIFGQEKQNLTLNNSIFYNFYKLNISKMIPTQLNPVFKEIVIKRYDHIHENYRDLVGIILRKPNIEKSEYWMDLIHIHYFFVIHFRDILNSENIYGNILYLKVLLKEITKMDDYINYHNIKVKVLYIKSILMVVLRLFGIDLKKNQYFDYSDKLNHNEIILIEELRKYIPISDFQILTSILSLVFSPLMRIQEKDLEENVLKYTNKFSFTINNIILNSGMNDQKDFKNLIKQYIYDKRNSQNIQNSQTKNVNELTGGYIQNYYALNFQDRESLTGLLNISEYYNIRKTKKWILEYLIKVLTSNQEINKNKVLDLLQLFELLENNILTLDFEKEDYNDNNDDDGNNNNHINNNNNNINNSNNITSNNNNTNSNSNNENNNTQGRLTSNELIRIFDTRIKNGVFNNILKLIKIKLKDENIIKDDHNNIIKIIPKGKTYLETIYGSEISFLGDGVIINKENFIIQKSLRDHSSNIVNFMINKKIDVNNILQYFTQAQLCNLEFLDSFFYISSDKNELWRQLINQIENFRKNLYQGIICNISSELKNQQNKQPEVMILSNTFFEYYLMKQYVRSQFESSLRKGKIERENLIEYLNYLKELILNSNSQFNSYLINIMIQVIKLLSIHDSYTLYLDYLKRKKFNGNNFTIQNKKDIEILENIKKNHIMSSLLDLDIFYDFEIEDLFDLENEILQENLLVDIIKESFVMLIKPNEKNTNIQEQSQVNLGKNYEHILKLVMKFDTGIIKLLFLNCIYHKLFNFKFEQILNLKSDYLSLFYYLNNQEIISKEYYGNQNNHYYLKSKDYYIKRITGYLIKIIFDFLNFINIKDSRIENINLDNLVDIIFSNINGNINNYENKDSHKEEIILNIQIITQSINSVRIENLHSENLLKILEKYFGFIYILITFENKKNQSCYNNYKNISEFEILTKTCLVVINLPIYYHCRNLFYIDENNVYNEYKEQILKNKQNMDYRVKNQYLSYFHHFYYLKEEKSGNINYIEKHQVIRKLNENLDDKKEFVLLKIKEIITEILENDLIKEFMDKNNEEKISVNNIGRLENLVIMVQNILSKNNFELFQGDLKYLYNDIFGFTLFNKNNNVSITKLLRNPEKQNNKSLDIILDTYEYENDLGLLPILIKDDITMIELWKSLLEVGKYIHEYNTEFLSLYNKYYQDFEYNVQKTHEKLTGSKNHNQEDIEDLSEDEKNLNNFISENHLIYKNDNIDKFIEKNHILNEFDLMNELISQSNKVSTTGLVSGSETETEFGTKYNNIKYICLKILEIIILRYGYNQSFKQEKVRQTNGIISNDYNDQMKRYIYYNMTYNDIKKINSQNEDDNCISFTNEKASNNIIWKFIILHLNNHKIFSQASGLDSGNYYQHIKIHIENEIFNMMINSEEKAFFNNITASNVKSILKNTELSIMVDLVERIQLMERLKKILNQAQELLLEYHDQPILVMIKDIVEKMIFMNIQKLNIITLICYLDILLMRLLKWQEYIKEGLNLNIEINNSILGENIDFIKYSIYELRKLQINSWFNLVFKIYQKYNYMASFSFGNILIIISKIMVEYEEFNHNLIYHEIFDYLKNSTRGEYPIRFLFLRYISDLIINILDYPKISSIDYFNLKNNQIIKLTKLSKILISILNYGGIIYKEILKDNQKLLQDIKIEIRDIIKLSMWEVKDFNKIKKNILSIQKQLKKSLLKFDEKYMIKVNLLINNHHNIDTKMTGMINILPKLSDFITNCELKGQEGISYIIKILSDNNNDDKMLKQRYYKTLIDMDTYDLEKLININNFNDFYYINLDNYINNQQDYIKIGNKYSDDNNDIISLCFLILDQLRFNENNKYNMQYISQSLINYNKLLSIGNTLLNNLINYYQEFNNEFNFKFLIYNYLLSINKLDNYLNYGNNLSELMDFKFCIINEIESEKYIQNNKITLKEYLNYLIKILNHLERIIMLLSSPSLTLNNNFGIMSNKKIQFLLKDKLKHDKYNHQIISFILDKIINKGLLRMISGLKNMFYISGLVNYYIKKEDKCIIMNWELMNGIEEFNKWIKIEIEELINIINLNFINLGIFELDIIQNYINKLDINYLDFIVDNNLIKELELNDLLCLNDLMNIIKQEIQKEDNILIKIFKMNNDINIRLDKMKSKFVLEYDSKFENLKSLSGVTLEYIQALYLLLENNFFNLCEKKEDKEDEIDNKGGESNSNIDWKSGCGFGNKDNDDYQSKDISNELNNDDSLLEGLKGDDENEIKDDMENKNKNERKKNDAIDTELDLNSKLEDLDEEDEEGENNDQNQKDNNEYENNEKEEPEKIFDKVDLEKKNSKIEDVKNDDEENQEEDDNNRNEVEDERKKENIETKNLNEEESNNKNKEKDIVAKLGKGEEENEGDNNKDENNEKKNGMENMDEESEKEDINSMDSDLDELFEYDAKNINPYTNEEEENKEENENNENNFGDEKENKDDDIDIDMDDNISISDIEGEGLVEQENGEFEEDDNDFDNYGDRIGEDENSEEDDDNEMKVDRYQSLGQNGMDEDMKEEDYKDQDEKGGDDLDSKNNLNKKKGKKGLTASEEDLKAEDKEEREDRQNLENIKNEDKEDLKIDENNGDKNCNEKDNGDNIENEFGSKQEDENNKKGENNGKDESDKKEELMNPLLEENSEINKDWYSSLKDLIIKDEENEDDIGEFDPNDNNSNFKIDKDNNSKSNIIQNLPSFGNNGSNKMDIGEDKERQEQKNLESEIIKQENANIEKFEDNIENSNKKDHSSEHYNSDNNIMMRNKIKKEEEFRDLSEKNDVKIDDNDIQDTNNEDSFYNKNSDKSSVFNCKEYNNTEIEMKGNNLMYEEKNNKEDEKEEEEEEEEEEEKEEKEEEKEENSSKAKKVTNLSSQSMEMWNRIQSEISPIVNLLSNQLRIILEPTIRGKMEGGFKTGKKLSMKKVITYIASDYRKDKIWLRRSKPSKREFNILMCIDNSQSMSISNNEYMALQSLFIIIQSLQKVEVGNFGVCSFTGENIKQLIEMTGQINNNDAINMLNHFNFSEETLDSHQNSIPNILKYSTNLLKEFSNTSSNSKQCHQLIIIITDGRFNKSKVNVWINYAIQNNCIPVLIIIDNYTKNDDGKDNNKNSSSSIFNMKSVNKDENGKMIITPYLENFPFPYYSVIQDPKKLPNILCELIKQWFELICN